MISINLNTDFVTGENQQLSMMSFNGESTQRWEYKSHQLKLISADLCMQVCSCGYSSSSNDNQVVVGICRDDDDTQKWQMTEM